ncbi:MAG: aminotransferase class V-fold PLP-dependent enzyme, partial [Gammaproteobacteria bacterium]
IFDYRQQAENDSMLNTPPTLAWYIAGLVFKHLLRQGGLEKVGEQNRRKAQMLYDYLDAEAFYSNPVNPAHRSWMNVPFTLRDAALDADFLKGAKAAGLSGLKGHRAVGGMRASIYNAMPEEGVRTLIDYLKEFARTRG